jgi:hypothetical protein
MKYLFLLIFIPTFSFAGILFTSEQKKEQVHYSEYKKVRISTEYCKERCLAKSIIDSPPKIDPIKLPKSNMKNPTSYLCEAYQGSVAIYYDEKEAEYSICIFKDKSSFLSWDFIKAQEQ